MPAVDFIHDLTFADLPEEVTRQAKRCLLDLIGVAAAGRRTELSGIVNRFAARHLGAAESAARMIFDGQRASPAGAAFAGASTIDSFDGHDGHPLTKGHAGGAVLPALLAIADAEGLAASRLTGPELLTALVIGYEVAIRAGIALHGSVPDYHTSGAWNALGCAAVAARLMALPREQTRHALGIAEYHGPRSQMMRVIDHPTMLKDGSGWGAFAGVSAACLAQDGFTGAPAITMEAPSQAELWSDLGSRWRIMELYFKPWPVCRWAQPAIEAAAGLVAAHAIPADAIAEIIVETFHEGVCLGAKRPGSTEEAQYGLGFPLAALLVRGRIGAEEIGAEGLADSAIAAMVDRIALRERAEFSAAFPARRIAAVSITRRDGAIFTSPPTTARGDADTPLPDDVLAAKFADLTRHLPEGRAAAIASAISSMDDASADVGALLDLALTV
jgi:2-methylcitrate dehydratase PrpD